MPDPTMSTILGWIDEKKLNYKLPQSLRQDSVTIALVINDIDMFLGNHIRKIYGSQFPIGEYTEEQKEYFLKQVELDSVLSNYLLKEIADNVERRNTAIMLWVGGIFGAKGTRRTYVTPEGEKEYSPSDRENEFANAESYATKNEIARTGVEAAIVLELLIKKIPLISLKRLYSNPNSPILKYVRNKNKDEISAQDLTIEYTPPIAGQMPQIPLTELFERIFDRLSGIAKRDVAEKDLVKSLVETGRFDEYNAKNHIAMAMRQGLIYERRAGFYAK